VSDEYVFPQDRESQYATLDGPKMIREGGLTKRELFAAMIYSNLDNNPVSISEAVSLADALLAELEKPK